MSPRLSLALDESGLSLPLSGTIAVFNPVAGMDLSPLARDRVLVVQPLFPDHAAFAAAGFACVATTDARCSAALVCLPRAKARARDLIAQAMALSDSVVIVDGAKSDGIDSLLRDVRARVAVHGPVSKAHGKLFWMAADPDAFADWRAVETVLEDGFVTVPGVFSADGIDPASRLLADSIPPTPGRNVVDLGAGWGFLAARALARGTGIETLDLVEANHLALDCARRNVRDPRARFHWADATTWTAAAAVDAVLMNPPFHAGRAADPGLGQAFIAAAARLLTPSGSLWMVANRHLPYEATLNLHFTVVREIAGDGRFKVMQATRPSRLRRGSRLV